MEFKTIEKMIPPTPLDKGDSIFMNNLVPFDKGDAEGRGIKPLVIGENL